MRSISADETGEILYVSDDNEGIIIINVASGRYLTLESNERLNLFGITDLIYDNNSLIFLQSSISPERVMKLQLEDNKAVIKAIIPIESSHPLFSSLATGVVVANDLFYIGNSQTEKADVFGGLRKDAQWDNMSVIKSDKNYNQESSLKYQQQIQEYEEKNKAESSQ